jgi:hypothetical protein
MNGNSVGSAAKSISRQCFTFSQERLAFREHRCNVRSGENALCFFQQQRTLWIARFWARSVS